MPLSRPRCSARSLIGRVVASCVCVAVAWGVAGCAGQDAAAGPVTPSPGQQVVTHLDDVPIESRLITATGYRLGVPASYQESTAEFAEGVRVAQWSQPHQGGPLTAAITVIVEPHPKTGAEHQGRLLERRLREEGVEVERTGLAWPGMRSAQLIAWQETPRGGGETRQIWQFMGQSEDGAIYSVVAFGNADEFATSPLPTSLATFTVGG